MQISEIADRRWSEVNVTVGSDAIAFVVFPWDEVKEREEDGGSNVWEYFIGFDGPVFDKVEAGEWIPFGAGEMYAGALKSDGGFQESGHRGMLFTTREGRLFYYDHNSEEAPIALPVTLADVA